MAAGRSGPGLWLALLGLVLVVAVGGYWAASGAKMVTQYQVAVTVVEEDEFGDAIERTVMQDEFRFGLLPDKWYDGAIVWLGLGGGLVGLGVVLEFLRRRRA